jgi:hypothetical protein
LLPSTSQRRGVFRAPRAVLAAAAMLQIALAAAQDTDVSQLTITGGIPGAHGSGSVRITQSGVGLAATVQQSGAAGGSVVVDQSGRGQRAEVQQVQGGAADRVAVLQAGADNSLRVVQAGARSASVPNAIDSLQAGVRGQVQVTQQATTGGVVALYQSPLATAARISVSQSAAAPLAVVEQGVDAGRVTRRGLDIAGELVLARGGQRASAPSTDASASIAQAGGNGLAALIVQSGGGQSASIAQNGAWLEAEVVQSGAAHSASIAQSGAGTASSPLQVTIVQAGNKPQTFSVSQVAGQGPRAIRVLQQ